MDDLPVAQPAEGGGGLYSPRYGDHYRGARGGEALVEAEHVFVRGNRLPERFSSGGARTWTIGEFGFGAGLSCCVAISSFLTHAPAGARLHFVSAEKHPLPPDLFRIGLEPASVADDRQVRAIAAALAAAWERSVTREGMRRLDLELPGAAARIGVFVLVDDLRAAFARRKSVVADAWFLDLFAPTSQLDGAWATALDVVGERSAVDSTAATWSVAAEVRTGLGRAGFAVGRVPGHGRKRSMTVAHRESASPGAVRAGSWNVAATSVRVHGAGLAGSAVAASLLGRGVGRVVVDDPIGVPARSSVPPLAVVQPRLYDPSPSGGGLASPDARIVGVAAELALDRLVARAGDGDGRWLNVCGALHVASDPQHAEVLARRARCGVGGAEFVSAQEAAELAGLGAADVSSGGVWLPRAGVVRTSDLLERLLAGAQRGPDADGSEIEVLATGAAAAADAVCSALPFRPLAGQLTALTPQPSAGVRSVVCAGGHLTPVDPVLGHAVLGATFDPVPVGARSVPDPVADERNLERFAAGLPNASQLAADLRSRWAVVGSWSGVRATTPDHLPYAGPVEREEGLPTFAALGLGSRGVALAFLCAEVVAAFVCGEPAVLDDESLARVLPMRWQGRGR